MTKKHIVIIGAGHNGLTCAAYLAKKGGHKVTVFEQSCHIGGAARSDSTTTPGAIFSTFSYTNSLVSKKVVEELGLEHHGYEFIDRSPGFLKVVGDRYLSLGRDSAENQRQIAKVAPEDALAYAAFEADYGILGSYFEKFLSRTPPSWPPRLRDLLKWLTAAKWTLQLGPMGIIRLITVMFSDARTIINRRFKSDFMRSALLPDSTIGANEFSGPVLMLHLFMGNAGGGQGVWGYQRGGMGGISKAIARSAEEAGAIIRLNTTVERILVSSSGKAYGVRLANGEVIRADIVVSNATPYVTFAKLIEKEFCPPKCLKRVENDDYTSGVMKINALLSGLPKLKALKDVDDPARLMRGTIHISPTVQYIEQALADYKLGRASVQPIIEMTIPSTVDDTLAPEGHHVVNMFVQYVPYRPKGGEWTEKSKREYLHKNILGVLREYCDNFEEILIDAQVLAPPDIERETGMTGGNIFHGALKLNRLWCLRYPYQTPLDGLWMCGSGTHPGGGVSCWPGHNAAHEILRSLEN